MDKPTILFTANTNSTFVKRDIALLERDFKVITRITGQPKSLLQFFTESIRSYFFFLTHSYKARFIFCWFADYHSLWPAIFAKLLNKPFYLVEGGYDTVYLKEYNYGVFTNPYRSFCVRFSIKNATTNLPVSNFLKQEIIRLFGEKIKIVTVPTGYDPQFYQPGTKKPYALTIAYVDTRKRMAIKGVDRVVALAAIMPDLDFHIIGVNQKLILGLNATVNVRFIDYLEEDQLAKELAMARVYVQFSVREGLPNAIFEAMLSECVTVGIRHSGLAEAISDNGLLLDEWNVQGAKTLVQDALQNEELGNRGRNYVINNFTLEHRYNKLSQVMQQKI